LAVAVGRAEPSLTDIDRVLRRAAGRRRKERILAGVLAVALTTGLAVGLLTALHRGGSTVPASEGIVGPTRVVLIPSTSMEPTLQPGDQVLVDEGAYESRLPSRGDIIAFTVDDAQLSPGFVWVKRVIGLPGDVVRQRKGVLYVNGNQVPMPSVGTEFDHRTLGPWSVGPGHVFVVGDDLPNSNDSRFALGTVPVGGVIGRVVEIIGPQDRVGGLEPPVAPALNGQGSGSP
jgi:signal peptidase I